MGKRLYEPYGYRVNEERLDRFELFRAALSPEERRLLDKQVATIQATFGSGHQQFGPQMARELLVALVDFWAEHAVARQP